MEMAQCGHPDGCCSGCSAVGAPRWARHNGGAPHWWHHEGAMQGVHGDGRSPVGARRWVQPRGCTPEPAMQGVPCSGCTTTGELQRCRARGDGCDAVGARRYRSQTPTTTTTTQPLGAQGSPPSRAQPKIRQGRGAQRSSLQKTPPAASAVPCRSPAPRGGPSTAPTSNSSLWRGAGAGAQREDASPRVKPRLKNGNMGAQMKSCLLWKKSH